MYIYTYIGISSYKDAMKVLYQKDLEICTENHENLSVETKIPDGDLDQNIIFHKNDSITGMYMKI
jgi:hypothetical protein